MCLVIIKHAEKENSYEKKIASRNLSFHRAHLESRNFSFHRAHLKSRNLSLRRDYLESRKHIFLVYIELI